MFINIFVKIVQLPLLTGQWKGQILSRMAKNWVM